MALLDELFKGGTIVNGLLIGAAFGIATRVVAPALVGTSGAVLRPVLKTAIKGGFIAWDYGRRLASEVSEQTSDVLAEARQEYRAHKTDGATASQPKTRTTTTRSPTGGTISEVPDTAAG